MSMETLERSVMSKQHIANLNYKLDAADSAKNINVAITSTQVKGWI